MEVTALVISILSFVATVVVYFMHDRKIKSQEVRINQYELAKFEDEEVEKKAARIVIDKLVEPNIHGYNNVFILISNKGKAKAFNLKVWTEPKVLGSDYEVEFFNPGQDERRFVVLCISDDSDQFKVRYRWEDGLGSHEDSHIISFG